MVIRGLLGHVGKEVLVSASGVEGLLRVHLRVVEEYGVWMENGSLMRSLLAPSAGEPSSQNMIFLPFAQVRFILGVDGETPSSHK